MIVCFWDGDPVPTFNWDFECQLTASEILTQPSCYKSAESNLLAENQLVVWVIHLYFYIHCCDNMDNITRVITTCK